MKKLQIPLATASSIATFLGLSLGADWDLIVSGIISVATYFGVFYTLTPSTKIGGKTFINDNNAEELQTLLKNSHQTIKQLENVSLNDSLLQQELNEIIHKGYSIVDYLKGHYDDLSSSRHFLSNYIPTLDKITRNYDSMEDLHFSQEKKDKLKNMTFESLQNLNKIFTQQLQNYHNNTIRSLEVEQELLSRTIKMGEYKE